MENTAKKLTPRRVGKWLFKWLLHALVTAILLLA